MPTDINNDLKDLIGTAVL